MEYKQSKTPYLSLIAAIALIAGIAHIQPATQVIHVSIEPSSHNGRSIEITGLQGEAHTILSTEKELNHEKENDSDRHTLSLN